MAQKPSIPKGTRDFSPQEMARRNHIFDTIRQVFGLYGYQPIETPAMEQLSTLMGKYGDEGDKLLFRVLNSGDFLSAVPDRTVDTAAFTRQIAEKGLRYDLTVPFARFVVQHRDQLQFPFKRYQMQPVWRADRPQKGRYREFYQCDADVIGSDSLLNEAELVQMIADVFTRLGIRIVIKLNNRKVLSGIAQAIGAPDRLIDITTAIDKIDKAGLQAVEEELRERGLSAESIEALRPFLAMDGTNAQRLQALREALAGNAIGQAGVDELQTVMEATDALGLPQGVALELDTSLARGLNYYTGTIIEVKAADVAIGSITGGGRYDNLTGVFGMPGVSGVGISFGADRIYDVLNALDLYPAGIGRGVSVMMANLGEAEAQASMRLVGELRRRGISAQVYPDAAKLKKQMAWANAQGVPVVGIIGDAELQEGTVTLKDMAGGAQQTVPAAEAPAAVAAVLASCR